MSIFKGTKCEICRDRRKQRFCLRRGKEICWECCNKLRYDRECPEECRYSLKGGDGLSTSRTNADSLTEYRGLITNLMDLWIRMPQEILNGAVPQELTRTKEGKQKIINYFNRIGVNAIYNIKYLKSKLELTELNIQHEKESYEDMGNRYLSNLLAGEIESALKIHIRCEEISSEEEWKADYIEHQQKDEVLKRMRDFRIISSALSENKTEALIFYDINGKYDLSLKLIKQDDCWFVSSHYNGKMEIVNGENEALKQIAVLISRNEQGQTEDLLKKYLSLYPDSSDLHYYQGVLFSIKGKGALAKNSFLRAVRLDPEFVEALYNYALQLHLEDDKAKATQYYQRVLSIEPDNLKSLNNMAAILIDTGKYEEAEKYLMRCSAIEPEYEPYQANLKRLEEKKNEQK